MARPKKEVQSQVQEEEEVQDTKEELSEEDYMVHVRLKKAQMLSNPLIGLDLNALMNKTTATLDKRNLTNDDVSQLRMLVGNKDIEVYDPNVPEPMLIPEYQLDLTDTTEYIFLNSKGTTENQIYTFIKNVLSTPRAAKIPLKVLYKLETEGKNPALQPRLKVVEAIVEGLGAIGVLERDAELTPVEKDKLMDAIEQRARNIEGINATIGSESDEVLTSVQ